MAKNGSVNISVNMETDKAERDLAELKAKIESLKKKIAADEGSRDSIKAEAQTAKDEALQIEKRIESLQGKLATLRETAAMAGIKKPMGEAELVSEIKEQEGLLKEQDKLVEKLYSDYDKVSARIESGKVKLEGMTAQAGEMEAAIDRANSPAGRLKRSFMDSEKGSARLLDRIKQLAMSALVFSVMTRGLNALRDWIGQVLETNEDAQASFARLRGALLTLAQPIVELVVPALTALANILTVIVTNAAALLSALFGSTLDQSRAAAEGLYEETEAIEGVGAAAKKAGKSLASFDEIDRLGGSANSGGAGENAQQKAPDFSLDAGISDRLKDIADLVMLIGAGLALWKISGMLPGMLGQVSTVLAGIFLTVGGLLLAWHGLSDAWENGVNWGNLIESIAGVAAAAAGLYLLFGNIGAGIGLIVGGIALLVTAFHDAMENGWNLQNTLMAIAGIMATGLGIGLITGSMIPLLIAGIAALLLALTVATGHGGELIEGLRQILQGFRDFFVGIFTGDVLLAIQGMEQIIDGLRTAAFAVIGGIQDSFNSFLDWLDEKTGGKLHGIIEFVRDLFNNVLFESIRVNLSNLMDALKQILNGFIEFITGVFTGDWDLAWQGVKDIFKGIFNGIISLFESSINFIVRGLNWIISQINKISIDVPDWVPFAGGQSWGPSIPSVPYASLPRLAQGAVLPPNKPFAAIVGDQHRGTNVEAPLETIKRALAEVMRDGRSGGGSTMFILQLDGTEVRRWVFDAYNEEKARRGPNLSEG